MRYTHFTIGSPFDSFNNDVELVISNKGEVHQSGGNYCDNVIVNNFNGTYFAVTLGLEILKEPDARITFYHDIYLDAKSVDFSFLLGDLGVRFHDEVPENFYIKIEWDKCKESKGD